MRLFLRNNVNKCIFSNVQFHRIKFHIQNTFFNTRDSIKFQPRFLTDQVDWNKHRIRNVGQGINRKFWKSVAFAVTFGGVSYVAATILEYERIRAHKNLYNGMRWRHHYDTSRSGLFQQIKSKWTNLTDAEKVFFSLFLSNLLVFFAWKVPRFHPFMIKYFTNHPAASVPYVPMVLSMFSHSNMYHLLGNMYALYSFSMTSVPYLGREHFLALYLTSGVVANVFSSAYKILTNQNIYSIGASGAIMGIVGFFCSQFPDTRLSILFLPFVTFNADMALKSLLLLETAGCVLKWSYFDHAAHLGGALFGMFWYYWGIENIWKKRTSIMMYWHAFREPPKNR